MMMVLHHGVTQNTAAGRRQRPITPQEVDLAGRAASVAGKRRSVVPPALRRSRGNRQALAQCM